MNQQVFKVKANGHIAQLSVHMRKTLCKLFPQTYPNDESLLVAQNNEDATAAHQVPSLPQGGSQLIEPSARPKSPTKRTMARTKTTQSLLAAVKKQQQVPKGKPTRVSPMPKDIGTQATPPAVSKKAAGEKRKQQAAFPKTSVGGESEGKGLTKPIRVVSASQPIASSPLPPVSAPLKEPARSQASSEAAISVPDELAGTTQPADKGPQSTQQISSPLVV